jgi:hypothetical protein
MIILIGNLTINFAILAMAISNEFAILIMTTEQKGQNRGIACQN